MKRITVPATLIIATDDDMDESLAVIKVEMAINMISIDNGSDILLVRAHLEEPKHGES